MNSGALQSTQEVQEPSFVAIDIYAKLVFSILNYFREQESSCKSFLLSKIVTVIVRSILKDADDEKTPLYPRPYFRLFINLLLDLSSRDHITDSENYQVLIVFANAFHALRFLKSPRSGYRHILVSLCCFLTSSQQANSHYHRLLHITSSLISASTCRDLVTHTPE